MAPTGLRDFFVSSVGDPFTSTQLLLPHSFLFFFLIPAQLSYSADTPAFPCLAEEICLNHGNEMFALAQSGSSISGGCFTKSPGGLFLFYLRKRRVDAITGLQKNNSQFDFFSRILCVFSFFLTSVFYFQVSIATNPPSSVEVI